MTESPQATGTQKARADRAGGALRQAVAANPPWYHTMELAPVVTPGWFDQRPVVGTLPWPDVRGKRCLDVGTYDGFLAFELERRGASEVIATDIADHTQWDWPARTALGGRSISRRSRVPRRGSASGSPRKPSARRWSGSS